MYKLLLLLFIPLFFLVGINLADKPKPVVKPVQVQQVDSDLITNEAVEAEVNQVRVQNGLAALPSNRLLQASAQARADELCETNAWSHAGFMASVDYKYHKVGENLEYGSIYQTARTIVQSWVKSPTHYANMTDPLFTEQGMGIRRCTNYQNMTEAIIVVNHFRLP